MRKLLLASAAAIGATAGMLDIASAQTLAAPQTQTLAPNPVKTLVTPSNATAANNNNNYQAAAIPGPIATPTPGSFVIRLNGLVTNEFTFTGSSANSAIVTTPGTTSTFVGPLGKQTTVSSTTVGKNNTQALYTYFRLYPGFDAMAANGLRYGGQAEIRENFGGNATSTTSSGTAAATCSQTLFVRRAFLYVAADQAGLLRIGQTDGVSGIFDNGVTTFQNFASGGWNSDASGPGPVPSNVAVTFPFFTQNAAEYGNSKFVYLSPQFAGFDIGLQYAPNAGNGAYSCPYAGNVSATSGTCPALSSSSTLGDGNRYTNQYVAGARYQGAFGPVALYAFGSYTGSGHVNYTGSPVAAAESGPRGNTYSGQFENLSVGFGGVALTYAGLTVGGAYQGGQYNGAEALAPQGGVKGRAWVAGAQYAIGPVVAGASFYNYQSQGAVALTNISQRSENGLDVGGTYNIAPGLWGFAEYLYGTRRQGDYNFVAGTVGAANNSVQAQTLMLGTKVRW